ncbi:MAG TPA: hypothetical protein VF476_18230 [Chitinophagaceae bacterium]
MKTHITLLAIAAVVINTAWIAPTSSAVIAKEAKVSTAIDPGFDFFRVHRQGKNGATATWGLTSNSGVTGFLLEKTYEDPTDQYAYWENVATLPATGERSYKHTDPGVYAGYITYRLTAYSTDGRTVSTAMVTLRINN